MTKRKSKKIKADVIPKPKFDSDLKEKAEKMFAYSTLVDIRVALIKEANILFAGSTDATLMCRKINEVFDKYVL